MESLKENTSNSGFVRLGFGFRFVFGFCLLLRGGDTFFAQVRVKILPLLMGMRRRYKVSDRYIPPGAATIASVRHLINFNRLECFRRKS